MENSLNVFFEKLSFMLFLGLLTGTFIGYILFLFIRNRLYKALKNILERCQKNKYSPEYTGKEIMRIYQEFSKNGNSCYINRKEYPNCVVWIDFVLTRINIDEIGTKKLKDYYEILKEARDYLESENPFSQCTPNQQRMLSDISDLKNSNNKNIIDNIVNRIEDEFLRQEKDIKKNYLFNIISLVVGVSGIAVSIFLYFIKI